MNNFVNLNVYLYENTMKNFILMKQTPIYLKKYLKKIEKNIAKARLLWYYIKASDKCVYGPLAQLVRASGS